MDKPTWTTERKKLSDLTPWPGNPREIEDEQAKRLEESFDQFGQVEAIIAGPDGEIYNGHQRLGVLTAKYGPDYEIDVRVSSRLLLEEEKQKLTVLLHEGTVAYWDWDLLKDWGVDVEELGEWGFDAKELEEVFADVVPVDYSDFDEELEELDGYQEENITITVPAMHVEAIINWLANGERKTGPGMGKGVMRRCELL